MLRRRNPLGKRTRTGWLYRSGVVTWLREAASFIRCSRRSEGRAERSHSSSDRQNYHRHEGAQVQESHPHPSHQGVRLDDGQVWARGVGDKLLSGNAGMPSQADELSYQEDDRRPSLPHVVTHAHGPALLLLCACRRELQHAKYMLQVAEMRLSEKSCELDRMSRLKRDHEKHASHWRKQAAKASEAAAQARESEIYMKQQPALVLRSMNEKLELSHSTTSL